MEEDKKAKISEEQRRYYRKATRAASLVY